MIKDVRREKVKEYLRLLGDLLCLKDWELIVGDEDPTDGMLAQMHCVFGQKRGYLRVGELFFKDDLIEQRQTITHELIHAHLTMCDKFVFDILSEKDFKIYNMLREYGVDGLADAVAPYMPEISYE